jgi:hypothetical protein
LADLERIERAIDEEPATVSVAEIVQSLRAAGSIADDDYQMGASWRNLGMHLTQPTTICRV